MDKIKRGIVRGVLIYTSLIFLGGCGRNKQGGDYSEEYVSATTDLSIGDDDNIGQEASDKDELQREAELERETQDTEIEYDFAIDLDELWYQEALEYYEKGEYAAATRNLNLIKGYKDADELYEEINLLVYDDMERLYREGKYEEALERKNDIDPLWEIDNNVYSTKIYNKIPTPSTLDKMAPGYYIIKNDRIYFMTGIQLEDFSYDKTNMVAWIDKEEFSPFMISHMSRQDYLIRKGDPDSADYQYICEVTDHSDSKEILYYEEERSSVPIIWTPTEDGFYRYYIPDDIHSGLISIHCKSTSPCIIWLDD